MKNYGYIPDSPRETDYILGGNSPIKGIALRPTGQWLNRIPQGEKQARNGVDSQSCVSFGMLKILQILLEELFSILANYSDRYLSSMSETTPQGNTPTNVADTLRKEAGCVDEDDLPFDDNIKSFNDYVVPKSLIPKSLIRKGEFWRSKYDFKYEKVFNGGSLEHKQNQMKEALTRSPIGVSGVAWVMGENNLYIKPKGMVDNHFFVIVGYEEGKKWIALDSYPETEGDFIKELDWNYDFGSAYAFYVRNIEGELSIIESIINWVISYLPFLKKQVDEAIKKNSMDDQKSKMEVSEPAVVEEAPKKSRIEDWAKAIEIFENAPKWWNNPGAIKGLDGKFLKFEKYENGFDYLKNYLIRCATGKHSAYPKGGETTMIEFQRIYSPSADKNNPQVYSNFICKKLGVDEDTKIKTLL